VSSEDQKNIDLILLTIGALVLIAVGIFVVSRDANNETLARMRLNDTEYQAAINERIEPYGRVVLDGEVDDEIEITAVAAEAAPVLKSGAQVYNEACLACHGGGIGGAPKTGDAAAWAARIAQGADVMNSNAINGFQGAVGFMPAKGGRVDFSDDEIIAAVEYLVEQAQ